MNFKETKKKKFISSSSYGGIGARTQAKTEMGQRFRSMETISMAAVAVVPCLVFPGMWQQRPNGLFRSMVAVVRAESEN